MLARSSAVVTVLPSIATITSPYLIPAVLRGAVRRGGDHVRAALDREPELLRHGGGHGLGWRRRGTPVAASGSAIACWIVSFAESIAIANPMFCAVSAPAELIPTTCPAMLSSGPPELPWLIAASVWITFE